MTAEHSSEEGGEGLSDDRTLWLAIRQALVAEWRDDYSVVSIVDALTATAERILADRLAAVQAEQAIEWERARLHAMSVQDRAHTRAESAEAERDDLRGRLAAVEAERKAAFLGSVADRERAEAAEAERDRAVRDVVALTENYVQPLADAEAKIATVEAAMEKWRAQREPFGNDLIADLRAALANPSAPEADQ